MASAYSQQFPLHDDRMQGTSGFSIPKKELKANIHYFFKLHPFGGKYLISEFILKTQHSKVIYLKSEKNK